MCRSQLLSLALCSSSCGWSHGRMWRLARVDALCRSSKAGIELGQGWTHGVWHDSASGLNRRISRDASCVIAAWRQAAPDMAGWEFDMKLKGDKAKEMWDVPALRQMERHDSLAAGADSAKDVRRRAQDHVVCH